MKKKNVIKIATDIDFNQGSYYLGSIHFIIFVFLMYEFCFLCFFLNVRKFVLQAIVVCPAEAHFNREYLT